MDEKPLVSIITPCYNGEKVVHRLLDSVLVQTYVPLEFIFVNDGSTDRTEEVFLSYRVRMEQQGIKAIYIKQENKGLGGAINAGLKLFTGDYLCWPDADDFLMPTSIEKRVRILEENQQYGSVTSDAYIYDVNDLLHPIKKVSEAYRHSKEEYQFWYMLKAESIFTSGCHMVRAKCFLDVLPDRNIYTARRGQNWQLLLPLYYKYKRLFLDEPLYGYIVSNESMSWGDNTMEKQLARVAEHQEIAIRTLERMNMPKDEKCKAEKAFFNLCSKRRIMVGIEYRDWKYMISEYFCALKTNPFDILGNLALSKRVLGSIYKMRENAAR